MSRKANTPGDENMIPPHDEESERAALGSMLMGREIVEIAADGLCVDDLYLPRHRLAFKVMAGMFARGAEIDEITAVSECSTLGVLDEIGGRDFWGRLQNGAMPSSIETYIAAVQRETERRKLFLLQQSLATSLRHNASADEMLTAAHGVLDGIEAHRAKLHDVPVDMHVLAGPVARDAVDGASRHTWGLACGIADGRLDDRTGGIQAGGYVILAGRASMGKSTFAYTVARGVRRCNPTAGAPLIVTNEMLPEAVARASLASEAGVHPMQLLRRTLGQEQRERVVNVMRDRKLAGVSVVHLPGATVSQVKALATQHQREHGLPLLVIDLAGRMKSPGEKEYDQLKAISNGLQTLAGTLKTCILACVQVGRAALLNGDKRPGLHDLKGCGSWEEDADQVLFLHRPAYFGGKDNRTEVILAKDRVSGNVGSVWMRFDSNAGQYVPADAEEE